MYTTAQKIELITKIGKFNSISDGCEFYNISRDTYYRLKKQYEKGGKQAVKTISTKYVKGKEKRAVELERELLYTTFANPLFGKEKIARVLNEKRITSSPAGVRYIWKKYDLITKNDRLNALTAKESQGDLKTGKPDRNIFVLIKDRKLKYKGFTVGAPGELGIHYIHKIKDIPNYENLFLQIYVDFYTNYVVVELNEIIDEYRTKDFIELKVDPFFADLKIGIKKILTPIRDEFCGKKNPIGAYRLDSVYRNLLSEYAIKHIYRHDIPIVETFLIKFENKFLIPRLRKYGKQRIQQLKIALFSWIELYNHRSIITAKYCFGKTPKQTLDDWIANN